MHGLAPGVIRDPIIDFLSQIGGDAGLKEIEAYVRSRVGDVPASSIRSYLNNNTPGLFERTRRGRYRHAGNPKPIGAAFPEAKIGNARLVNGDAFEWLAGQPARSITAFVTDPPYGVVEYSEVEKAKLRAGRGGVWRIPPSFDGHQRAPLPRFTTLKPHELQQLHAFFKRLGVLMARAAVPGANVVVASNPLLSHIVATAMSEGGLELRGYLVRQVQTMRGGDRPKNAHQEFEGVSVMPRSQWEPWVVLRAPLEGRVQDCLRKWGTGGFRRISDSQPFGDMIKSTPTPAAERKIANHPSLKPQALMRQIVRAVLPLGKGVVCDPFAGGGSTLAAANAIGYHSVGIEMDPEYYALAKNSIQELAALRMLPPSVF